MAVRLSVLRAGRPLPPRKIPGTHFCQRKFRCKFEEIGSSNTQSLVYQSARCYISEDRNTTVRTWNVTTVLRVNIGLRDGQVTKVELVPSSIRKTCISPPKHKHEPCKYVVCSGMLGERAAGDLPHIVSWEGCLYSVLVSDGTALPSAVIYVSSLKFNTGNASLGFRTMFHMCREDAVFVRLWGTQRGYLVHNFANLWTPKTTWPTFSNSAQYLICYTRRFMLKATRKSNTCA
jgi:hypothetical protein